LVVLIVSAYKAFLTFAEAKIDGAATSA